MGGYVKPNSKRPIFPVYIGSHNKSRENPELNPISSSSAHSKVLVPKKSDPRRAETTFLVFRFDIAN